MAATTEMGRSCVSQMITYPSYRRPSAKEEASQDFLTPGALGFLDEGEDVRRPDGEHQGGTPRASSGDGHLEGDEATLSDEVVGFEGQLVVAPDAFNPLDGGNAPEGRRPFGLNLDYVSHSASPSL